jgi:hypothetical protein
MVGYVPKNIMMLRNKYWGETNGRKFQKNILFLGI